MTFRRNSIPSQVISTLCSRWAGASAWTMLLLQVQHCMRSWLALVCWVTRCADVDVLCGIFCSLTAAEGSALMRPISRSHSQIAEIKDGNQRADVQRIPANVTIGKPYGFANAPAHLQLIFGTCVRTCHTSVHMTNRQNRLEIRVSHGEKRAGTDQVGFVMLAFTKPLRNGR